MNYCKMLLAIYDFVCTSDINRIRGCNFYVVAVPTPVDANNRPDLTPLWRASETVGKDAYQRRYRGL